MKSFNAPNRLNSIQRKLSLEYFLSNNRSKEQYKKMNTASKWQYYLMHLSKNPKIQLLDQIKYSGEIEFMRKHLEELKRNEYGN